MKQLSMGMAAIALVVAGCSSTPEETATAPAPAPAPQPVSPGGPAPNTVEYFNQVVGDRVFFATDQHTLSSEARSTLDRQAQWLQTNAASRVTIEGHADERGTRQYNLALGARRANSVRRYLVSRGVDASRLRSVTFGKERPVALCSNSSCWSQNRRGVSVVLSGPTS